MRPGAGSVKPASSRWTEIHARKAAAHRLILSIILADAFWSEGALVTLDILVKNVALWGTEELSDVGMEGGRFVSIDRSPTSPIAAVTLDAEGRMAVPGFVEPHIHLDKALISERAPVNVSGTLTEAIEILWEIKRNYTVDEIAERASRVLARAIENGVSRLRSHVDVDPIGGTRPAEGLIRARERFRDLIDIQIVAFPQEGIVKSRVTAGHTCALASYPRNYADHVIERLHAASVNMIANPATNLMLQGRLDDYPKRRGVTQVKELLAAGVNVACGQDCVHDTFYPFGQNDPLEIAFLLCHASHMSRPAEILTVMDMVTGNGAKALRVADFGVAVGGVADLVVLDARDAREAFATRTPRRWVIRRGRLIAEGKLEVCRHFDIPAMPPT